MDERSSLIKIGDKEYELILTTKATKEIAKKYGGLSNLGDSLLKNENFDEAINEVVWLITLLANQSILIHNLKEPNNKQSLLTEEEIEILTSPYDLADYKDAIVECMSKGTKRYIKSEEVKNTKTEQM